MKQRDGRYIYYIFSSGKQSIKEQCLMFCRILSIMMPQFLHKKAPLTIQGEGLFMPDLV